MQRFDWDQDDEHQKERRMQERRQRVQERLEAQKLQNGSNTSEGSASNLQQQAKGRQEAQFGLDAVKQLLNHCDETVTAVREQAEQREEQRKEQWEQQEQWLKDEVAAEAETSKEHNRAIDLEWEAVQNATTPQQALEAMATVQKHCEQVLNSKDGLIAGIKGVLKERDEVYISLLQSQTEETDALIGLMSQEYDKLKRGQEQALEATEAAYLQERSELISAHKAELDMLLDKRSGLEQGLLDQYLKACETYENQLEDIRLTEFQEYTALRRRLEKEVASLETYLDSMRSVYILNSDKLEYNVRVLSERERESKEALQQQKRKITRQWEVLARLKKRFAAMEKKGREENLKLADEYQRVVRAFNHLQTKFKRLKATDLLRFEKMRAMKEEEFEELAAQLAHADGVITQLLLVAPGTQAPTSPTPDDPPALVVVGQAVSSSCEPQDLGLVVVGRALTASSEAEAGGEGGSIQDGMEVEGEEVVVLPIRDSLPSASRGPGQQQPHQHQHNEDGGLIGAYRPGGVAAQRADAGSEGFQHHERQEGCRQPAAGGEEAADGRKAPPPAPTSRGGEETADGRESPSPAPTSRGEGVRAHGGGNDGLAEASQASEPGGARGLPAGVEPLAWQELRESMEAGVLSLLLDGASRMDSARLAKLLAQVPRAPGSELWGAASVARALGVHHAATQRALERAFMGELQGASPMGEGWWVEEVGDGVGSPAPGFPPTALAWHPEVAAEEAAAGEAEEGNGKGEGGAALRKGHTPLEGGEACCKDAGVGGVRAQQVEAGLQLLVALLRSSGGKETGRSVPSSPGAGGAAGRAGDPATTAYWQQRADGAFPLERFRTWAALEPQLQRLLKLLKARSKAAEQVAALKAENEGLKARLREQLTSPLNDEMQLPTKILLQ